VLVLPSHPSSYLLDPTELSEARWPSTLRADDRKPLEDIFVWTRDFMTNPHPELGRAGVVCPFVKPSLDKRLFWLTAFHFGSSTLADVCDMVMRYRDWFIELEPRTSKYKAFIILMRELPVERHREIILGVHKAVKPSFLARGAVLGEFFPGYEAPGVCNPDFRPLSAPEPMFVIRSMIPRDEIFFKDNPEYHRLYLQMFGKADPTPGET
jgi:hypothetical protein